MGDAKGVNWSVSVCRGVWDVMFTFKAEDRLYKPSSQCLFLVLVLFFFFLQTPGLHLTLETSAAILKYRSLFWCKKKKMVVLVFSGRATRKFSFCTFPVATMLVFLMGAWMWRLREAVSVIPVSSESLQPVETQECGCTSSALCG